MSPQAQKLCTPFKCFVHLEVPVPADDWKHLQLLRRKLQLLSEYLLCESNGDNIAGHAVIFLDPKWMQLLTSEETYFEGAICVTDVYDLKTALGGVSEPNNRIHLFSSDDLTRMLKSVLSYVGRDCSVELRRYLCGNKDRSLYDTPKLVKWIAQVANCDAQVPVFTFDQDVLFPPDGILNADEVQKHFEDLRDGISELSARYVELRASGGRFIFSGTYAATAALKDWEYKPKDPMAMSAALNGFATRLLFLAKADSNASLDSTVAFDQSQVKEFLGRLSRVGADPYLAPISGAGLCMSDGIALFWPPHSQLQQKVVWIDDYLLFWLHRHLAHLDGSATAKPVVEKATFKKHRDSIPPKLEHVKQTLNDYLPGFILGCIADAWINQKDKNGQILSPGPYAEQFRKAMVDPGKRQILAQDLWAAARTRLTEIVDLASDFNETFFEVFVHGSTLEEFGHWSELGFFDSLFAPCGLKAAVSGLPKNMPQLRGITTNPLPLQDAVRTLIDDFLAYLDFVRFWPSVAGAVANNPHRGAQTALAVPLLPISVSVTTAEITKAWLTKFKSPGVDLGKLVQEFDELPQKYKDDVAQSLEPEVMKALDEAEKIGNTKIGNTLHEFHTRLWEKSAKMPALNSLAATCNHQEDNP